jgi:hypothetical protein
LLALSLSPELRLAAACCIWPPSHRRTAAIRKAAEAPIDWTRFLRVVGRHRIVGLVHNGLKCAQSIVPPEVDREIGTQAAALVRQNLEMAAEGLKLQRLFAEADTPVVFMKGVTLAMVAYGDLGLRHSRDFDIVVHRKSIPAANRLLEGAGYRRYEPSTSFNEAQLRMWLLRCKELSYVHERRHVIVELHSRLFDNAQLMADTPVAAASQMVAVTEGNNLCTFGEDDLFAYLCAHGAIHCWFRLKWLADIGALLARQPEGGVERLYLAADARGVGRCAAQAIFLCRQLLGTAIPDQLITTLSRSSVVQRLEAIAMKAMTAETEPTEQALGTFWANLSHFLLDPSWRYWLAELKVQLISPVDILTLPLTDKLQLLYPALRIPLWLYRRSIHRPPAARDGLIPLKTFSHEIKPDHDNHSHPSH